MKEVWCMAGIPCSGKTTTAKALERWGYAHFEQDKYVKDAEEDIQRCLKTKDTEALLAKYRKLIQQAIEFYSQTFSPNRTRANIALGYINNVIEAPDQTMLSDLFIKGPSRGIIFNAARYQMLTDAFASQNPAILDTMEYIYPRDRKETIEVLRQNQLSPRIIIIQNTRRNILQNAQTRRASNDRFAHTDNQINEWFEENESLLPAEKWDRVAVINNSVPQTRESIRAQIAKAFHPSTMTEPIPFLI